MNSLFLTSPHSGEKIPPETAWLNDLNEVTLMRDVDRYVDQLYRPIADKLHLPFIVAEWHRYAADLNRTEEDIDPTCVVGANQGGEFPEGMGIHWSSTTFGETLMPNPISMEEHKLIVEKYHRPFHQRVSQQFEEMFKGGNKKVYHLDCHSMPSLGTKKHRDAGELRPEIVISDVEGSSCEEDFKNLVIDSFEQAGFQVSYNWPYKGGRVTQTYGKPSLGQNSIQVEMRRNLYMNEETKQAKKESWPKIQSQLTESIRRIIESL